MQTGVVEVTIELQATPDVLTHVARLTETVLAVDAVMTVRRGLSIHAEDAPGDIEKAMHNALTGEQPPVEPDEEPPRRGRRTG